MKIENESIHLSPEELITAINDIDKISKDLKMAVRVKNARNYLFVIVRVLSTQKIDTERLMTGPIISGTSKDPTQEEILKTAVDIWMLKNIREE